MSQQPYDFAQAREACSRAARAQAEAERDLADAAREYAEAERVYRVALARKIIESHDVDKMAWTVCQDIARGDQAVADLRYKRDVAKGVYEAQQQRSYRHSADRRDVLQLVQWSSRVAPDGQYDEPPTPLRAA